MIHSDRSWSHLSGRNLLRRRLLARLRSSSNKQIPITNLPSVHRDLDYYQNSVLPVVEAGFPSTLRTWSNITYTAQKYQRATQAGGACLTTTAIYIDYTFYDFRMMHATLYLIAFYFLHSVYISFICTLSYPLTLIVILSYHHRPLTVT